jgi:hypothetical protein
MNIKITQILTVCALLLDCKSKSKEAIIYHIIKSPQVTTSILPPPPVTYYGNYNFILLNNTDVYVHIKFDKNDFGTGIEDLNPPKINLNSNDVIKIEQSNLKKFLESMITDSLIKEKPFFSISSPNDTIKNRGFNIISNFLKSKHLQAYTIRTWTDEEKFAIKNKIKVFTK